MTWLAPWALVAGGVGLLGVVAAHLLSRQRPRALSLATVRFLPAGMLDATTLQTIPIDRWWMLLRLCIVALLALGVAQPVLTGTRVATRTVLLLDRTLPVDAQRTALGSLRATDVVIAYDTLATLVNASAAAPVQAQSASLSAALTRLVRVRDSLARRSERLRIEIASRLAPLSLDPATPMIRALLPDSIVVLPVRVTAGPPVVRGPIVVRADGDDPVAATAHLLGDSVAPIGALVQRGAVLTPEDSVAASTGATVVWWPARVLTGDPQLSAITTGARTWIAPLGRDSTRGAALRGQPIGWWADGSPAASRQPIGEGCLISFDASLPVAGDQTLSLGAQAWLSALITSCDRDVSGVADAPAWLAAVPRVTPIAMPTASMSSGVAPWLVAAALVLVFAELALRRRRSA